VVGLVVAALVSVDDTIIATFHLDTLTRLGPQVPVLSQPFVRPRHQHAAQSPPTISQIYPATYSNQSQNNLAKAASNASISDITRYWCRWRRLSNESKISVLYNGQHLPSLLSPPRRRGIGTLICLGSSSLLSKQDLDPFSRFCIAHAHIQNGYRY